MPDELVASIAQREAEKAAAELAGKSLCATCGKRRDDKVHAMTTAVLGGARCTFVEAS